MRRGQKPSRHYRRVRTRRGYKKVLVNKNIKKRKGVSIRVPTRRLLNHMSNPKKYKYEFGGAIDYDKKGQLDALAIFPGHKAMEVDIPEDYEVQFHTHPTPFPSPPSPEDVIALLKNPRQQVEMVVRDGKVLVLTKSKKTRALGKLPVKKLMPLLEKEFYDTEGRNWEKKAMKAYERLGFGVQLKKRSERPIKVMIKPRE